MTHSIRSIITCVVFDIKFQVFGDILRQFLIIQVYRIEWWIGFEPHENARWNVITSRYPISVLPITRTEIVHIYSTNLIVRWSIGGRTVTVNVWISFVVFWGVGGKKFPMKLNLAELLKRLEIFTEHELLHALGSSESSKEIFLAASVNVKIMIVIIFWQF